LRHFWYHLKGLLKGFWWPFRLLKLVKYSQSYGLNKVCNTNAIELDLPSTVKIHPVVNVSRVHRYKDQVEGQRKEWPSLVVINGKEEYCHDLAKWLSHYFILLSFSFLFFSYLDLLHKEEVWESVI